MSDAPPREPDKTTLEPKLTKRDLRVLRALPAWLSPWGDAYSKDHPINVWRVGEILMEMDLADLHRTLNGLDQLDYVMCCGYPTGSKPVRWMRTDKGDKAVAA